MARPIQHIRDKQICVEYESGCTPKGLGSKYAISNTTVMTALHRHNITIRNRRKHYFDLNFFHNIDNEYKAYALGFMFADGNISSKKYNVRLTLAIKDYDHLDKIRKLIESEREPKRIVTYGDKINACSIIFHSKEMWRDLYDLGCIPNKSLKVKFPKLRSDLIRHFIRGYFDGDGSIGFSKNTNQVRVSFVGTYNMMECIRQAGFNGTIRQRKNIFILTCVSTPKDIVKYYHILYDNISINMNRKYVRWIKAYKQSKLWIEVNKQLSQRKDDICYDYRYSNMKTKDILKKYNMKSSTSLYTWLAKGYGVKHE